VRKLTIKRLHEESIGGTELVVYSQKSQTDYHEYFGFAGN